MFTAEKRGYIAAVCAPFFIALSIILTKEAGASTNPLVISGYSMLFSVPFLLLMQLLSRSPLDLGKLLTTLRVPFLKVLFTRAIIGQYLIVTGFTMTSAVKAVLLLRLEPIFVFFWSLLLRHEKPKPRKVFLLSMLLVGSALVVSPQGPNGGPNIGDALVVVSLLFLSYSYIPTKQVVTQSSTIGLNLLCNLIGGLVLTGIAGVSNPASLHQGAKSLELIAAYSVVFFVLAATLYFEAFKTLKPWIISSFLSLEVVFGLILAYVMLHETTTPLQLCGATIVLLVTVAIAKISADHAALERKNQAAS
jgi:drug/metabolite transporter (DMT)-like permease